MISLTPEEQEQARLAGEIVVAIAKRLASADKPRATGNRFVVNLGIHHKMDFSKPGVQYIPEPEWRVYREYESQYDGKGETLDRALSHFSGLTEKDKVAIRIKDATESLKRLKRELRRL